MAYALELALNVMSSKYCHLNCREVNHQFRFQETLSLGSFSWKFEENTAK